MPEFAYIARDLSGKKISGTITAGSEREAASQLGAKSLFPVEVTAAKGSKQRVTGRVKGQVMSATYSQMASLLRSGVPMLRALTVLSQQTTHPTLKTVLTEIKAKVEEGESLGDAMTKFPRVFNDMAVNMVKAGSEGGFLEDSLERVGGFIEQQEDLKAKRSVLWPIRCSSWRLERSWLPCSWSSSFRSSNRSLRACVNKALCQPRPRCSCR